MATGQYDDAWETPGWTAQNFAYPADPGSTAPALPVGVIRTTVTGTYVDSVGGANGRVVFTPISGRMLIGTTEVIIPEVHAHVHNGTFEAHLLNGPQDSVWRIREAVGPTRTHFTVVLPHGVTDVDLSALARVIA